MKKGFTLIELLAVIVILAIIALIATPIILGVVENARKSAAGSSALGYIDAVEKEIALGGFDETIYPTGEVDIVSTKPYNTIDVNGSMPSKGILNITDNYVVETSVLCINNYKVDVKGHKVISITKDGCDDMKLKDVTPPVFSGIEDTEVLQWTEFEPFEGVTATDDYDGNVTENIEYEPNGFTTTQTGEYTVTYKVSDLAGNEATAERKITVIPSEYIDNCGASKPNLKEGLIPVTIEDDGTVKKADLNSRWYDYDDKKWANAVILVNSPSKTDYKEGDIIAESDIRAYFVWIPKFRYQLWDLGNYSSNTGADTSGNARIIQIKFNTVDTKNIVGKECIATNKSGDVGECNVDEWMTHPAFTSFGVDGFWVGKFETTGTTNAVSVKPNNSPIIKIDDKTSFELSYKYNRTLDSHMIKNTEWGAIAYLSHSKYGIGGEVGINSYYNENYMTGCGAAPGSALMTICNSYNTTEGIKASTTGNITGVYDMSGGMWDRIAAYHQGYYSETGFDEATINQYNEKYFDVYKSTSSSDFTGRILGDATGEMGPFKDELNSWYGDQATFVNGYWFIRGGYAGMNNKAGIFAFGATGGSNSHEDAFRIILAPK